MRALFAPFRWLYGAFLRWCIWEAENHLYECSLDGLDDSLSLRDFRGQISEMRVRLALLQTPGGNDNPARAKGARQLGDLCEQVAAQPGGHPSGVET